jgi:hypothetical protein
MVRVAGDRAPHSPLPPADSAGAIRGQADPHRSRASGEERKRHGSTAQAGNTMTMKPSQRGWRSIEHRYLFTGNSVFMRTTNGWTAHTATAHTHPDSRARVHNTIVGQAGTRRPHRLNHPVRRSGVPFEHDHRIGANASLQP